VLDGVKIGMGCMNLVTVISRYTWYCNLNVLKVKVIRKKTEPSFMMNLH